MLFRSPSEVIEMIRTLKSIQGRYYDAIQESLTRRFYDIIDIVLTALDVTVRAVHADIKNILDIMTEQAIRVTGIEATEDTLTFAKSYMVTFEPDMVAVVTRDGDTYDLVGKVGKTPKIVLHFKHHGEPSAVVYTIEVVVLYEGTHYHGLLAKNFDVTKRDRDVVLIPYDALEEIIITGMPEPRYYKLEARFFKRVNFLN